MSKPIGGFLYGGDMTDHVHNQLCARIEELEKEKLELNEQLDIAQQQCDALAAHVERCRDVFSGLSEYWNGCEGMAAENAAQNAMDVACDMLEELPETSLARLKAQWQAEALEWVRANPYVALNTRITELRRQAEGGE